LPVSTTLTNEQRKESRCRSCDEKLPSRVADSGARSLSAQDKAAQTSPKGTFRIETVFTKAEDPADEYEQQYVVATADPNIREPLGEKRQVQPATYFNSMPNFPSGEKSLS
jgi:hypothetical protein